MGEAVGIEELGSRIVAMSGRVAAATCRWLLLVAEFDAAGGAVRFGLATTARWLGWSCALSERTAIDHVRVARALAAHPVLAEAMSAGRVSYSHARAISRITRPEETRLVAELVEIATYGTVRHVESMVRGLRTVRDADASIDPEETVRQAWTDTSQWRLSARLHPERGAVLAGALDRIAAAEDLSREDSLVRLAEIAIAAMNDAEANHPADVPSPDVPSPDVPGASDTPATGRPRAVRGLRGHERAAFVVHLNATTWPGETASPDAVAEAPAGPHPSPMRSRERPSGRVADGPGLPRAVLERLACAGRVRLAVRDGERPDADVLNLGRAHRLVTDRQYRALLLRQGRRCAHPGCPHRLHLDAHHVVHWLRGGSTDLDNLVLLCTRHHADHHDGSFVITATGRGHFRFDLADGTELPDHPDATADIRLGPLENEHAHVAPAAAASRWDGRRLDHHYAVAGLAQHLRPA